MTNLRTKKKQKCRQLILNTAKDIFFKSGYSSVTMAEIAKKAEIGTGTIYNYFQSKADLFLSLLSDEEKDMETQIKAIVKEPSKSISDSIQELIMLYTIGFKIFPKQIWKEVFSAVFGEIRDNRQLKSGLNVLDKGFITNLNIMLVNFRDEKKAFGADFDTGWVAQCIYDICVAEFMFFVIDEEMTFEHTINNIGKMVRLIVK